MTEGTTDETLIDSIADVQGQPPSLKHLCRWSIRNHLLEISLENLFVRLPQLVLPPLLVSYLLYNVSLDTEECGTAHCHVRDW